MTTGSTCLLKATDDAVAVLQSLVTMLADYYEIKMKEMSSRHAADSFSGPDLEAVQLTFHSLSELMASIWPCEKKFVAVFGPTGCGKSTLLNVLLAMMCTTAEAYQQGIKIDSSRVALRETAKIHGFPERKEKGEEDVGAEGEQPGLSQSADQEDIKDSEVPRETLRNLNEPNGFQDSTSDALKNETISLAGLLGVCCAQSKEGYMRNHLPQFDKFPFLLQNGRLGDAGTIKVTAIEHGPKFIGHISWTSKKKLRKRFRKLRQLLGKEGLCPEEEQKIAELKELWQCMLKVVEHPSQQNLMVLPKEENINRVILELGKKVQLGREEVIQTEVTKGCTVDRITVRDGMRKRLHGQIGQLAEEIRLEVPVPSFEGGVSLLDVPGTNDPRILHQLETRDAIDRTSLILLILDKSVIDQATQKLLLESPILERMIMDETAQCNLVVVGIAEKVNGENLGPKELIDGFDPKNTLRINLKKIFNLAAGRLVKNRRIETETARMQVARLFEDPDRIAIFPVLPLLCASIHLSASNPFLHGLYCESKGSLNCPLLMSMEKKKIECLRTNIPQLLEKIHSVRLPPNAEDFCSRLESAATLLELLIHQSEMEPSYVDFLKREKDHAKSIAPESILLVDSPAANENSIKEILCSFAMDCLLQPEAIEFVKKSLNSTDVVKEIASCVRTRGYHLAPYLLHGFRPEMIGEKAQKLIQSVDLASKDFVVMAFGLLKDKLQGDFRIETTVDKVNPEHVGRCISLYEQLENRWKLSLDRLRAKCFCGGIGGGLLGQVRVALRKAYDRSIKNFFGKLKQEHSDSALRETLNRILTQNEVGQAAAEAAESEVLGAINAFWSRLLKLTGKEVKLLWKAWQREIEKLVDGAVKASRLQQATSCREGEQDRPKSNIAWGGNGYQSGQGSSLQMFQEKLIEKKLELRRLVKQLGENTNSREVGFHYGYSLLQNNPQLCSCLFDASVSEPDYEPSPPLTPRIDSDEIDAANRSREEANLRGCDGSMAIAPEESPFIWHNYSGHGSPVVSSRSKHRQSEGPSQRSDLRKPFHINNTVQVEETSLSQINDHEQHGQLISERERIVQCEDQALSPKSPKLMKLNSFRKAHRGAVVLSETESRNLQIRETNPRKKARK